MKSKDAPGSVPVEDGVEPSAGMPGLAGGEELKARLERVFALRDEDPLLCVLEEAVLRFHASRIEGEAGEAGEGEDPRDDEAGA